MQPVRRTFNLTLQPHLIMPVRLSLKASPRAAIRYIRTYSSDAGPIINVVNLPAPNTGHIRILELNRPAARNAISKALLASLRAEIDDIQSQYTKTGEEAPTTRFGGAAGANEVGPTRALVLASAVDASFCAGADLKERRGFTPEESVLHHLYLLQKPQIS
jgi:methylglutaconyl-CoA hydratase